MPLLEIANFVIEIEIAAKDISWSSNAASLLSSLPSPSSLNSPSLTSLTHRLYCRQKNCPIWRARWWETKAFIHHSFKGEQRSIFYRASRLSGLVFQWIALWSGTNKNRDVSAGPLARRFARWLAPLTCSLAHSLRSLPRSWESEFLMSQNDLVLSHSALGTPSPLLHNLSPH